MSGSPTVCPVCGRAGGDPFLAFPPVPVYCNVLWPTREEALAAPRGEVELVFCDGCGMVWNARFDPGLVTYAPGYENSLHFSPVFQRYAEELAARLRERYDLHDRDIVEIGSGKGEFLSLLCRDGGNRGVGFDPSYEGESDGAGPSVRFVRDVYSDEYSELPADLVCSRHVLEHLAEPRAFVSDLRRTLEGRPQTVVYVEVPSAEYLLRTLSAWDVIYEHCSIFSAPALRRLFEEASFDVLDIGFSFGGQYLWIEARPAADVVASPRPAEVDELLRLAVGFDARFRRELAAWRRRLPDLETDGGVALWGAGSKGITFLNLAGAPDERVDVVDVNPRKHGRHVPGTGQRVGAPEELAPPQGPARVLITNPNYRDEIGAMIQALGLEAEVVPV